MACRPLRSREPIPARYRPGEAATAKPWRGALYYRPAPLARCRSRAEEPRCPQRERVPRAGPEPSAPGLRGASARASPSKAPAGSGRLGAVQSAEQGRVPESAGHAARRAQAVAGRYPKDPVRPSSGHRRRGADGNRSGGWRAAQAPASRCLAPMPEQRPPATTPAQPATPRPPCFPAPNACVSFFVRDPELSQLGRRQ